MGIEECDEVCDVEFDSFLDEIPDYLDLDELEREIENDYYLKK